MNGLLAFLGRWGVWAIVGVGVILAVSGLVSGTMRGVTGGAIVIGVGLLIGASIRSRK
ncbi:hypothetical protein JQU17_09350 [Ponticoccus sp. SC2-23]|uniref:hypothetical protein n=1 Tax=Alexandriicola marinus TaxID=2081710 RepID=UPI0013DEA95F|nr:hypothetical protein [Alexandriicola marinus]MBM1220107.1 hypothetical protein [Ponticoccus sp. SC6-9]MBM1224793.1 hypothetical protein [Ponticoccus sp. SC6-15]MBM1228306.1 hypothetical protein [Ponticoccus sp. SC6-38]MBM1234056.1 hypothetical protein [Ponticoccus sp. SC6-45]MBM1238808.1 hypothetical protein [Ponticoccus sp. SC6-49]MBM1242589.1 hypothetical protein [Ponticoccus sp. SC2-64]MBM1247580.1 hypothetical protein [Ponticoccus sp. SC6-42]MBM1251761.1 hypothetical protein [Pontico